MGALTIEEVEIINKRLETETDQDIKHELMIAVITIQLYARLTKEKEEEEKDNGKNAV